MAISRERLEELIKQGATVYSLDKQEKYPIPIFLKDGENVVVNDNELVNSVRVIDKIENLYKTHEDAEWALKYHATRTEELDLPTWEEIQSNLDEVKNGKDKINISFIKRFNHSKLGYILLMLVKIEEKPIQLEVSNNVEYMQRWVATEENYIKACDLCLKQFKGEENV